MDGRLVCLGCGGHVDERTEAPTGETPCTCPPPAPEVAGILCSGCGGSLHVGARGCPHCGSTMATRRCAACLAWNLAEARRCLRCDRDLAAEDASAGGASANIACPRCAASLWRRRYEDMEVDECDRCGGLFVEPAMMDRIVAARDATTQLRLALPERAVARETSVRYVPCPRCGTVMNRRMFGRLSGVVVDVCREHGVWFDPGELTEVLAFVERGGLERARARERQELADAARASRSERTRAALSSLGQAGALEQASSWTGRPSRTGVLVDVLEMLASLWW